MTHYALIVEDHPLYREGLSDMLGLIMAGTVVLKAATAEEGLLMTGHLAGVRLICIDLGLPKIQGVDALSIFRIKFPSAIIVVVSGNEQEELRHLAIERGANAFIPKSATPNEIISLVRSAMAGEMLAPGSELMTPQQELDHQVKPLLTLRQNEVLKLMADGHSNKQIARQLNLAEVTVKLHVTGIFRAFGANCRSQALNLARKAGLLAQG